MAFGARARLGPYEIQSAIGAGGMGEVYKARDTRLDRTVAIKVLPASLADDVEFRARFEREARTISQLEHPHICALYDVGDHDGRAYLVMQYLEGETLAARLERGALPLPQALDLAIQIGAALDKAHRSGIVHRDLKPGNVMLTKGGAKLLDFGLAKAAPASGPASAASFATREQPLTGVGTILGTLQYMAPEQLEGGEADARSDIFAFGCVLYEMLAGRKAFDGKTPASVMSAILKDEPRPLLEGQPLTAPAIDHVVRRCLAKDPDERWQTASDVMRELKWILDGGGSATSAVRAVMPAPRFRRGPAAIILALLAGAVLGAGIVWLAGRNAPPVIRQVTRAAIDTAPAEQLLDHIGGNFDRPNRHAIALSPDGRSIVFVGTHAGATQLYLRALDRLESVAIAGSEGAASPFFSPDGRWLGFWAQGEIKKAPLGGGPAVIVCRAGLPFGATWGSDDVIVFARAFGGLWQVPAAGGTPTQLTAPDTNKGEVSHRLPHALPGGDVLFTVTRTRFPKWDETQVVAYARRTRATHVLVDGGADARYAASGHLVYARTGTLMAVPFDLSGLRVTGGPVGVVADVMQAAYAPGSVNESGAGQFAVSESGDLAYVPGGVAPDVERSLVWIDRAGRVERLGIPSGAFIQPRLSPSGRQIAVATNGRNLDIWLFDISRGMLTRLTTKGRNGTPVWTSDGIRVIYRSGVLGPDTLVWQPADGSGSSESLLSSPHNLVAAFASSDGKTLGYYDLGEDPTNNNADIWALAIDGRQARSVTQSSFGESGADLSFDGRWLAYAANDSGRNEVYLQPYGRPGARQQISVSGGVSPTWRRDGKELFYLQPSAAGGNPAEMMSVAVTVEPTFVAGRPVRLFQGNYPLGTPARTYDVTPDGQRFVMTVESQRSSAPVTQMILVENWLEELKTRFK